MCHFALPLLKDLLVAHRQELIPITICSCTIHPLKVFCSFNLVCIVANSNIVL